MSVAERQFFVTCEHGGNGVPQRYRTLFGGRQSLLASHRGWDPGALTVARELARSLDAPLVAGSTTRLLVDLNRSPHNPAVFSEFTRRLPRDERDGLLARYHRPYWDRVRALAAVPNRSFHVSVHSFTPVLRGEERNFAMGILYDPGRSRERALARAWKERLQEKLPGAGVRRNAPYRGNADGVMTALRRALPQTRYLALELELNQRALSSAADCRALAAVLVATLSRLLRRPVG